MSHVPVMAGEWTELIGASAGQLLVDLTVGAGGHSRAFLEAGGRVVAADRDPDALALAEVNLASFGDRISFRRGDSVACLTELAAEGVRPDAILLDLGVSSMQLDEVDRGFSLRDDGPLDMRMDPSQERTAADVVNGTPQRELERLLRELGDEHRAERLAAAIVERRKTRPFRTTGDLRELVERVVGGRGGRLHPATKLFQAVRMVVNDELGLLSEALPRARELLKPGGHLAVISFHSGEDREVKTALRAMSERYGDVLVTPRPVKPSHAEQRKNRRSRSARLRVLRRAPAEHS